MYEPVSWYTGVDGHACMCIGIYNKTYIDYNTNFYYIFAYNITQ